MNAPPPRARAGTDARPVRPASPPRRPADDAYDEYLKLVEAGHAPDPDEFCQRYPAFQNSLRRLISIHQLIHSSHLLPELPLAPLSWPEMPLPPSWPKPGQTFLQFELLRLLGRGAFSRVFLAVQPRMGYRRVAVKITSRGGHEAATLGPLHHPNIVLVHSVHDDPSTGLAGVCMAFQGAATLLDILDRAWTGASGPHSAQLIAEVSQAAWLPHDVPNPALASPAPFLKGTYTDAVAGIGVQLADALAFIHARGIFHRDLKPSNVLLTPQGRPMLLDFNLAQDPGFTNALVGGTIVYMSPEQLQASKTATPEAWAALDGRSDLFALGVILYELLSGAHPFGPLSLKLSDPELRDLLLERQPHGPIPLRQVNPGVDRRLAHLIEHCLAADPLRRWPTAAALALALRAWLAWPQRLRRWGRRCSRGVAATASVLATVTLLALHFWPSGPLADTPAEVRWSPSDAKLNQGWQAYRQARYEEAIGFFKEVIQEEPKRAEAWFGLGRAHQQLHNLPAAMNDLRRANRLAPDGRILACLGYCAQYGKEYKLAIGYYQKALGAGYATAEVHCNLGACFRHLKGKDRNDPSSELDLAINQNRRLQTAWYLRALIELDTAKENSDYAPRKGIEAIEEAIQIGPPRADLHFAAALLHAHTAKNEPNQSKVARVLAHLKWALEKGEDPQRLKFEPVLNAVLVKDREFQAMLARPRLAIQPSRTPQFLDPVPGDIR